MAGRIATKVSVHQRFGAHSTRTFELVIRINQRNAKVLLNTLRRVIDANNVKMIETCDEKKERDLLYLNHRLIALAEEIERAFFGIEFIRTRKEVLP